MKFKLISIALLSIVFFHTTYGQHGVKFRGSDGWGMGGRYEQYFDKYNLKTFSAKIIGIDTAAPFREMSYGIQLTVKKDNREQVVHLGPGWFILYQDMNLNVNNDVEVRGCEATIEGKTVIMAVYVKQVSKGRTLYLRDDDGIPYWCAWRRE
ncbi:MAG TPA: hypothetical protein VHP36_02415 [Chitinispirillaceae bacterium]|nr:hypothetical protein [Chitinispirillaceae bacterium]